MNVIKQKIHLLTLISSQLKNKEIQLELNKHPMNTDEF